jgi:hypothetical protein
MRRVRPRQQAKHPAGSRQQRRALEHGLARADAYGALARPVDPTYQRIMSRYVRVLAQARARDAAQQTSNSCRPQEMYGSRSLATKQTRIESTCNQFPRQSKGL